MTSAEFSAARAQVRPRVRRDGSALPRLLEEEIAELLAAGKRTEVCLKGAHRSGVTTALQHLAAMFAGEPRLWLGEAGASTPPADALVTVRGSRAAGRPADLNLHLLPWTDDDVLEYLLAEHRDCVGPVFTAWCRGAEHDLRRQPGLCRSVLDTLAKDPALGEPRTALTVVLQQQLGAKYAAVADCVLRAFGAPTPTPGRGLIVMAELGQLVRSGTAIGQLASVRLLELATQQDRRSRIELHWPQTLRTSIEHALRTTPDVAATLRALAGARRLRHKALVLGSLCIHEPGFRPTRPLRGNLRHAWLHGIDLGGLYVRARLQHAELDCAQLSGTHFDRCDLAHGSLRASRAERSQWTRLRAPDLRAEGIQAPHSHWIEAKLRAADFRSACLDGAEFPNACLDEANFQAASLICSNLRGATFSRARLDGANLQAARCDDAHFLQVDLHTTKLAGASCHGTRFTRCDLSGTDLPGLQAPNARFVGCDLTGARWRGAQLAGASFAETGLADVDWEGADLRGCDLRRATFHLGNARSGLVDSTIASEGSRTGFYTDESLEEQFRAPEDVRKANLRGCDLRGAHLDGTDFYLVDLRGALLEPGQRSHLQRCRAILDRD